MKRILSLMILLSLSFSLFSVQEFTEPVNTGRKPPKDTEALRAVKEKLHDWISLIAFKEVTNIDPTTNKKTKEIQPRVVTDTEKAILKTLFEILYPQKYNLFDIEPVLSMPPELTGAMMRAYNLLNLADFHLTTRVPFIVHIIEQLQLNIFAITDSLIDLENRTNNIRNLTIKILEAEHDFNKTDCRNNIDNTKADCIKIINQYNESLAVAYCELAAELQSALSKAVEHRKYLDKFEKSFFRAFEEEIIYLPSINNINLSKEDLAKLDDEGKEAWALKKIQNSFNNLKVYFENLEEDLKHTYNVTLKKLSGFYKIGNLENLKNKCPYLEQNWGTIDKMSINCDKAENFELDPATGLCKKTTPTEVK